MSQIAGFFSGLEMIGPGLTDINDWPASTTGSGKPTVFYGGVGIKPGAAVRPRVPHHLLMARFYPSRELGAALREYRIAIGWTLGDAARAPGM